MAPPLLLTKRGPAPQLSLVDWVGIGIGASVFVLLCIWLMIRLHRKRKEWAKPPPYVIQDPRMDRYSRNSSVLAVLPGPGRPTTFSRAYPTPTIVAPPNAIITQYSPHQSDEAILMRHKEMNSMPKPFAPHTTLVVPAPSAQLRPPPPSAYRGQVRLSASSITSATSAESTKTGISPIQKTVRQIFNPLLPDELVLTVGDRVMVVQSYVDGWCIIGREDYNGEIEMGAAPSWCFIKPIKGLKAERPERIQSLGVTVDINQPTSHPRREEVVSWSNF